MANPNAPFGLAACGHTSGIGVRVKPYYVPAGYATALYMGDPVLKTGTTNTGVFKGNKPGTLVEINKAVAGDTNKTTGVIAWFEPDYSNPQNQYNPASTEKMAFVIDDPAMEFEIQANTSLAVTDPGLNGVYIYGSGSIYTGLSGCQLDTGATTALATTATFQLKVLRFSENNLRNDAGNYCVAVVRINNHSEANGVIGF